MKTPSKKPPTQPTNWIDILKQEWKELTNIFNITTKSISNTFARVKEDIIKYTHPTTPLFSRTTSTTQTTPPTPINFNKNQIIPELLTILQEPLKEHPLLKQYLNNIPEHSPELGLLATILTIHRFEKNPENTRTRIQNILHTKNIPLALGGTPEEILNLTQNHTPPTLKTKTLDHINQQLNKTLINLLNTEFNQINQLTQAKNKELLPSKPQPDTARLLAKLIINEQGQIDPIALRALIALHEPPHTQSNPNLLHLLTNLEQNPNLQKTLLNSTPPPNNSYAANLIRITLSKKIAEPLTKSNTPQALLTCLIEQSLHSPIDDEIHFLNTIKNNLKTNPNKTLQSPPKLTYKPIPKNLNDEERFYSLINAFQNADSRLSIKITELIPTEYLFKDLEKNTETLINENDIPNIIKQNKEKFNNKKVEIIKTKNLKNLPPIIDLLNKLLIYNEPIKNFILLTLYNNQESILLTWNRELNTNKTPKLE